MRRGTVLVLVVASWACAVDTAPTPAVDRHVDPLVLTAIGPASLLPGSTLTIEGEGFAPADIGPTRLELRADDGSVDLAVPATYVSGTRLEIAVDGELFDALGGAGTFAGGARLVHEHGPADRTRHSPPIGVRWLLSEELAPPDRVASGESLHLDDPVHVSGGGVLLGGDEGETWARVWGCFVPEGESGCRSVEPVEVRVTADPVDRSSGSFPFSPAIAGVGPGSFRGTVRLANVHGPAAGGRRIESEPRPFEARLLQSTIYDVDVTAASLGQYVGIAGAGFAGADDDSLTLLEVRGTFRSATTGNERPLDLLLVPEYRSGRELRYVLSEDDPLGAAINLRRERGTITGTVRPVVRHGDAESLGTEAPFAFDVAPLRQIVKLTFQPSYVESLRAFGLRAAEPLIRERIVAAAGNPYRGVNVEMRTETPTDFALYAHVDLAGPDPNGTGLFGYDNTPGKDTGNLRLHDRIGGVNATTQLDGYPGYGGVFVESFMGFSEHPGAVADPLPGATPTFDALFDPFRPDVGGTPVSPEELEGLPEVVDGSECPAAAGFRPGQIACAIWALGNLVGSTVAHEVGHSLGLANPHDEGFHNDGDLPGRLMDSGGARPFEERAQIDGSDAAVFCGESFEYLRDLMPSLDDDPLASRPSCE